MTEPNRSLFRNALQVSPERIAAFDDAALTQLMRDLLPSQAYRCISAVAEIRVNTEGKAKDDGCDGWSPKPPDRDDWFGSTDTCWQFKAGSAGEPARLKGEISKPIPKNTLSAGGRFVLVAAASTNGKKGEEDRLEALRAEALAAGLPTGSIDVYGSERLANWCNQHPAVAARWAGRPDTLWRLEDWLQCEEHRVPWQSTPATDKKIADQRTNLDLRSGTVHHLHIQGLPGVGKSRFALELCRDANWRDAVIYIRQASDVRLAELIDGAVADLGVQLVIVADEMQAEDMLPLRDSIGRGSGRIRLITIGHCRTPDPRRIPELTIEPLEPGTMTNVIRGWYPSMPFEHVDFIVRFADGYVRLARLAADAVVQNAAIDVRGLLDLAHIRGFLDKMLGAGNRRFLHVVAVLTKVGWTEDMQVEGQVISSQLGLDWNEVRAEVEDFHSRLGIVPRGGRYRYISPTPLGIHLAVEAWKAYSDILRALPPALPSDEARDSYYERLQSIASNPEAREFAREELSFFFRLDDFIEARNARRWSALSSADPAAAARNIKGALAELAPEERMRISDRARREIVWALVRLAWTSAAFHDATMALALLAEAENETWANNATGEFVARFKIIHSGTAAPYLSRLLVLDELLALGRPALTRLVVRALTEFDSGYASYSGGGPLSDVPEPEWWPSTGSERFECAKQAMGRLIDIAKTGAPDLMPVLIEAATELSMLLRVAPVREFVADLFEAVRHSYPDSREALRRTIADILHREQKHWKELPIEDVDAIKALHALFEDSSLPARLHQYVGQVTRHSDDQIDLTPLATELMANRNTLEAEWPWLTSTEAGDGWRFGEALATVDSSGELEHVLPALKGRGQDLRVICGYVHKRKTQLGIDWYDTWITTALERDPSDMTLLFEATWRCGVTAHSAHQMAAALRQQDIDPRIVGKLGFGLWGDELSFGALAELLQAMFDRGHKETAVIILAHRIESKPDEADEWDALALAIVTSPEVIRSRHIASFEWKEVASTLMARHARTIAAAIFREQADRESGTWFAEHSEACSVLDECVIKDATGVWEELKPHLSSKAEAVSFSIGFPRGILERLAASDVLDWIAEQPDERAYMIAHLVNKDLSSDETLASHLIGIYGDNEEVSGAFLSEHISGSWTGPSSAHWEQLATGLDEVARRTSLPKLKRWAEEGAQYLRKMAESDRQREEEENLGRR